MISQLLAGTAGVEGNYTGSKFMDELGEIVIILVTVAGSLMVLYAVYIGYLFATATDAGRRKAAKDRLFKVLSSALIIYALAASLSVIKITFTKVEGADAGNDSPAESGAPTSFVYIGMPTLTLKKSKGSMKVESSKIQAKDSDATIGVITIYDIMLNDSGSNLPQNPPGTPAGDIWVDVGDGMEYRLDYLLDAPKTTVRCYEYNGTPVLLAKITFYCLGTKNSLWAYVKVVSETDKIVVESSRGTAQPLPN